MHLYQSRDHFLPIIFCFAKQTSFYISLFKEKKLRVFLEKNGNTISSNDNYVIN